MVVSDDFHFYKQFFGCLFILADGCQVWQIFEKATITVTSKNKATITVTSKNKCGNYWKATITVTSKNKATITVTSNRIRPLSQSQVRISVATIEKPLYLTWLSLSVIEISLTYIYSFKDNDRLFINDRDFKGLLSSSSDLLLERKPFWFWLIYDWKYF